MPAAPTQPKPAKPDAPMISPSVVGAPAFGTVAAAMRANQARWVVVTPLHLADRSGFYGVEAFRAGADALGPIEAADLEAFGDLTGTAIAHLQCHFGLDSLSLARRGASVTGVDFSRVAIETARQLAAETGLDATFIEANVYDTPDALNGQFDLVFVTWGAITWLPDVQRWAAVVSRLLRPGGRLYLADAHPAALMLEQNQAGQLQLTYPYFQGAQPFLFDDPTTYNNDATPLKNTRAYEWNHSLSAIFQALAAHGLSLTTFAEHDGLVWPMFASMIADPERPGLFRLPDGALSPPLSFSLTARKSEHVSG